MPKFARPAVRALNTIGFNQAYGFFRSRLVRHQVAIVAYHSIGSDGDYPWSTSPIGVHEFDRQMRFLRQNYQIITLEELAGSLRRFVTLPSKTAVVTFDDGYKDFYLNAYPVLQKYGIPATVFLVTGHIGTGSLFWFDRIRYAIRKTESISLGIEGLGVFRLDSAAGRARAAETIINLLKKLPVEPRDLMLEKILAASGVDIPVGLGEKVMLNWEEIKEMSRHGINFGSHTVSHPILTSLPLEAARKEILDSKNHAEAMLGREINTFCYPNGEKGDYNGDIEEILENSGFKCAVTLEPAAFVRPATDPYRLPRIPAVNNFDIFEFMMSGLYLDLYAVARRGTR